MKSLRVNDNVIRVSLAEDDFKKLGFTLGDVIHGDVDVQDIFDEVIDELDVNDEFEVVGQCAMQLAPAYGGLELYISNSEDADAFKKFMSDAEYFKDVFGYPIKDMADGTHYDIKLMPEDFLASLKDLIEDPELLDRFAKEHLAKTDNSSAFEESLKEVSKLIAKQETHELHDYLPVFKFASFENFVQLAQDLVFINGLSHLYTYEDEYYLVLEFKDITVIDDAISHVVEHTLEYSQLVKMASANILHEHGQLVMKDVAIELARYYFK
ncbi:adaptor protein MecA [Periweissella beninensis]|uniref:adaptor protein MecA n=1 Tax=Periweissella beninensis TaxID=504936 RepID=UPI0021A35EA9|nr:adaptor protein MecA [Periweissella beninensis]